MSDAIKQWAATLVQARPVLRSELVFDVVDKLLNPRSTPAPLEAQPAVAPAPAPATNEAASRARLIFHAADEAKPFDPNDLNFEFDEKAPKEPTEEVAKPEEPLPIPTPASRRGISPRQWIVLVFMILVEFGVLAGFLYLILFGSA